MTDETPVTEVTALDAVVPEVESSTTPDEATETPPTDDAGTTERPRDAEGRFISHGAQKRIDELTWEKYEALRRADALAQELAAVKTPKPEPAKPPGSLEEFGFDEAKHRDAWAKYNESIVDAKVAEALAKRDQQRAVEARTQTFRQKEASFLEKTPDYREVAYRAPISDEIAQLVMESDLGPELAYYLGKNPALAQEISNFSGVQAARALGRVEERLESQKRAPAAPAVSKAPPPPPKIAATDSTVSVKPTDPDSDSSMSDAEWFRAREEQIRRKS
jgi:hypothetical protein